MATHGAKGRRYLAFFFLRLFVTHFFGQILRHFPLRGPLFTIPFGQRLCAMACFPFVIGMGSLGPEALPGPMNSLSWRRLRPHNAERESSQNGLQLPGGPSRNMPKSSATGAQTALPSRQNLGLTVPSRLQHSTFGSSGQADFGTQHKPKSENRT